MRVLIVGSIPGLRDGIDQEQIRKDQERYREACRDIGHVIARHGWSVNVATDREDSADRLVVDGIRECEQRTRISVHWHDNEATPFEEDIRRKEDTMLKQAYFVSVHGPGNWVSGRIKEIRDDSDIVILIAGKEKTAQAFHTARILSKPCVPVVGLGGASGELWDLFSESLQRYSVSDDYLRTKRKSLLRYAVSAADLRRKIEPWRGESSAEELISFSERLVENAKLFAQPSESRSAKRLAVGTIALSTIISAYVFFGQTSLTAFSIFLILFTSSFMGAGLNWFWAMMGSQTDSRISPWFSWPRAGAGLMVAVGLFMLFLVGGIAINGDTSFLNDLSDPSSFYRRAAVSTIFGLAAGLMTEMAIGTLTKGIGSIIGAATSARSSGDDAP